ncbi:MAG TPA: SMI1/KNR4 family protein [Clostridia bacterium]
MELQNNSLQEEIRELQGLCKRMEDMEINESRFDPPATEEEILDWERTNGITIPESYKEWLRFSAGSQIFTTTARFFGVKEIVVNKKHIPDDLVNIGELIGDGELLCFSKETGKILSLFEGEREDYDGFKEVLIEVIRLGKNKLGEDESSRDITAKLMALLETQEKGEES